MGQSVQQEKTQMSASRGDGMWMFVDPNGVFKVRQIEFIYADKIPTR